MSILFSYISLYKRYKWIVILGVFLSTVTLLGNIGILILSNWFLSSSAIIGINGIDKFNYMLPAVGIRAMAIIRIFGRYFDRIISHDFTLRVLQHLRTNIFKKIFSLSLTELMKFRQGELLNRIVADVNTLDYLYLKVISPLLVSFVVISTIILLISTLNTTIFMIFSITSFAIFFIFSPIFYFLGKNIGERLVFLRSEYRRKLVAWLQEQSEMTVFCLNKEYRKKIKITEMNWKKTFNSQNVISILSKSTVVLIGNIVLILVLWGISIGKNKDLQISGTPLIATFSFCILSVFETLATIINSFQYFGQIISSSFRINEIIKQKSKVQFLGKYSTIPSEVSIFLDRISFIYEGQRKNIIEKVTFFINSGTHLAILGRTGCGKSTLLRLLIRTWDPKEGNIILNNTPLKEFNETTLRKIISVVPQYIHLFNMSLRDNLLLSSIKVNDKILYSILEKVKLHKLLDQNGLNGWLGEGGRQLSGGELRRLAIARVLLRNTPVILLDEPTEGLDLVMENQIINLLKEVMYQKTLIMVTHRLRLIKKFDRVVIMNNGKLFEKTI